MSLEATAAIGGRTQTTHSTSPAATLANLRSTSILLATCTLLLAPYLSSHTAHFIKSFNSKLFEIRGLLVSVIAMLMCVLCASGVREKYRRGSERAGSSFTPLPFRG